MEVKQKDASGIPIIFDTDIGNDVDDVPAMGVNSRLAIFLESSWGKVTFYSRKTDNAFPTTMVNQKKCALDS